MLKTAMLHILLLAFHVPTFSALYSTFYRLILY